MRIISFGWTTPALLAGQKTVTRRQWKDSYARRFVAGQQCQAWDKLPRTGQGKAVGVIQLIQAPYLQRSDDIPLDHWYREGFDYLHRQQIPLNANTTALGLWCQWITNPEDLWVVEFKLVKVCT